MYALEDAFLLLINSMKNTNASEFLAKCKEARMIEKPIDIKESSESTLLLEPEKFDRGYAFSFTTDDSELVELHVGIKDEKVCRAEMQITYKAGLLFSRMKKHYKKIIQLGEKLYWGGEHDSSGQIQRARFEDKKTFCWVMGSQTFRFIAGVEYLNITIGNVAFEFKE